jgi:hypothetical protein
MAGLFLLYMSNMGVYKKPEKLPFLKVDVLNIITDFVNHRSIVALNKFQF